MAAESARKFTIVDVMALVAATAAGLAVSRALLLEPLSFPDPWTWGSFREFVCVN